MISKRIQFLTDRNLCAELLEVINEWSDGDEVFVSEDERLALMDKLFNYLKGRRGTGWGEDIP